MKEHDKHYDGNDPQKPLPSGHFAPRQGEESEQLGDGSPAVAPREGQGAQDRKDESDSTPQGTDSKNPQGR